MAQKKHVVLVDDINGSPASQTVLFALDGVDYEIDLNDAHAEAVRESFTEWFTHARRLAGRRKGEVAHVRLRAAAAATTSSSSPQTTTGLTRSRTLSIH